MREQDRHQKTIGQETDKRIFPDWEVVDGPTDIVPLDQRPPTRDSQHPLAKKDYIDGEYTVHKDEPEDPVKRSLILGGLAALATAAVSVFSGNKPETQSLSIQPETSGLSLGDRLAAIQKELEQLNQQGVTIPTPQAQSLAEKIAKIAESPAEVVQHLAPPSISPVQTEAGPAVSPAQKPPEVKLNQDFLRQVQVKAAELPPVVAPVRISAPSLRTISWNEAPPALKQQVPNPEAVAAPSLEELQTAFTGLINGLAQGDDIAIERQTAWLRQNAPLIQPLVASLTRSADKLITLENAGALYPTPFVYQLIETIHQLDPTTPEGKTLLDRAVQFQQAHLNKLAQDAQEMLDAANAIKTHPQTIELPQAVMSPDGIHIAPPPDVVSNLAGEAAQTAQNGDGLIFGPIAGPRLVICPSDPFSKLVDSVRTLAGLQPLGPARYKVQRIEKLSNLVPDSLFGKRLAWLNALADRITYAELTQTQGLFNYDGFGPPIYMLNASGLQVRDEIGFGGVVDIFLKSLGVNP